MKDERIDEVLWQRARELAAGDGLTIEGLGTFAGGRFTPAGHGPPPTGYDAPKLVVAVGDQLEVSDDAVRARLRAAVKQAVDSAVGRPAPLLGLGLIERDGTGLRFFPARRTGTAAPGAVDAILAAWRAPADPLDERIAAVTEAMAAVGGALPEPDLRRLLDELDYDLDEAEWRTYGDRIVAALPC